MHILVIIFLGTMLSGCNPIPTHPPCNLPKLITELPITPIKNVRTRGFFNDTCPAVIPKRFNIHREWGTLKMKWQSSPHQLWMKAFSNKGEKLIIRGPNVEAKRERYWKNSTSAIKFGGQLYIDNDVATTFELQILDVDNHIIDELQFGYDTEKCICIEYDAI